MKSNFTKLKREIIPFVIFYVIFDIVIVGTLVVALHNNVDITNTADKIVAVFEEYFSDLTSLKFFTAIFVDFLGFLKASLWTLLFTIILFLAWKIKFTKTSEYEGIEI